MVIWIVAQPCGCLPSSSECQRRCRDWRWSPRWWRTPASLFESKRTKSNMPISSGVLKVHFKMPSSGVLEVHFGMPSSGVLKVPFKMPSSGVLKVHFKMSRLVSTCGKNKATKPARQKTTSTQSNAPDTQSMMAWWRRKICTLNDP